MKRTSFSSLLVLLAFCTANAADISEYYKRSISYYPGFYFQSAESAGLGCTFIANPNLYLSGPLSNPAAIPEVIYSGFYFEGQNNEPITQTIGSRSLNVGYMHANGKRKVAAYGSMYSWNTRADYSHIDRIGIQLGYVFSPQLNAGFTFSSRGKEYTEYSFMQNIPGGGTELKTIMQKDDSYMIQYILSAGVQCKISENITGGLYAEPTSSLDWLLVSATTGSITPNRYHQRIRGKDRIPSIFGIGIVAKITPKLTISCDLLGRQMSALQVITGTDVYNFGLNDVIEPRIGIEYGNSTRFRFGVYSLRNNDNNDSIFLTGGLGLHFGKSASMDIAAERNILFHSDDDWHMKATVSQNFMAETTKIGQLHLPFSFFYISVVSAISLFDWKTTITGIDLGVFSVGSECVYGLQGSLLHAETDRIVGFQFAGLGVAKASRLTGYQMGIYTAASEISGWQYGNYSTANRMKGWQSGAVAIIQESIEGVQFGFVAALAEDVYGLQVGYINYCDSLTGLQLGAVNYCNTLSGVQLGFVNIALYQTLVPVMIGINVGW